MAIFYRQLLALDNVAQALQMAQQEMQQNPNYRNPFYWAAYTLTSVSPDQSMRFSETTNIASSL
jgi:CHAT domain-containing protein